MRKSELELQFEAMIKDWGLPPAEREYRFAPPRRWRFDFAWPEARVAVEIEGGVWSRGRHVRPSGYEGDLEKYNAATVAGWRVLRFSGRMLDREPERVRDAVEKCLGRML